MSQRVVSRLVDGKLITEVIEDTPVAAADVAALREQIESATNLAELKEGVLSVLDLTSPPENPNPEE